MIFKLFCIFLIHVFFCEAVPGNNEPYQHPNNVNKVADCKTSLPDQNTNDVASLPLNTDRLVQQPLKDESKANFDDKPVPYLPKSNLNDYRETYDTDGKQNHQPLTLNSDLDNLNRKENNRPQTESTELGKLIEKCVTAKLKDAKRNKLPKQLDSEEFLNTRRSNNDDREGSYDSLEVLSRDGGNVNRAGALVDPTQGAGLKQLTNPNSNVLLMNNKRVCYACTSANNPNCWVPNRYTTVKYCNRQNEACLTKTYNSRNGLVVIRDCGNSCIDKTIGVQPEFKTCSICHNNLCNDSNGAFNVHVNLYSIFLGLILVTFVKRLV